MQALRESGRREEARISSGCNSGDVIQLPRRPWYPGATAGKLWPFGRPGGAGTMIQEF
jgi:hypothetical protein